VVAIIGHISAFSRKRTVAAAEELDIDAVVQSALSVAEAKIAGAGVSVRLEIADDLPPARGVAVLVEQIVVNLIVNACDAYMDKPDIGDRYVTISMFCLGDHFILRVSDKAGGIPQDMIGNIFDPFVTSKPPGKGTGLGLSFCLASVGRFGGRMTVENVDGGARFDVSMPIGRARTKELAMVEGGGSYLPIRGAGLIAPCIACMDDTNPHGC
jgi:C4-dicarboxylate-specific signal transduction histidine kinase